ncbi:hypothetical protein XELAEV_18037086mg, partial [Xenopus laevis]
DFNSPVEYRGLINPRYSTLDTSAPNCVYIHILILPATILVRQLDQWGIFLVITAASSGKDMFVVIGLLGLLSTYISTIKCKRYFSFSVSYCYFPYSVVPPLMLRPTFIAHFICSTLLFPFLTGNLLLLQEH